MPDLREWPVHAFTLFLLSSNVVIHSEAKRWRIGIWENPHESGTFTYDQCVPPGPLLWSAEKRPPLFALIRQYGWYMLVPNISCDFPSRTLTMPGSVSGLDSASWNAEEKIPIPAPWPWRKSLVSMGWITQPAIVGGDVDNTYYSIVWYIMQFYVCIYIYII